MGSTTTVTEYEYDIDGRIKRETVTTVTDPLRPDKLPAWDPESVWWKPIRFNFTRL